MKMRMTWRSAVRFATSTTARDRPEQRSKKPNSNQQVAVRQAIGREVERKQWQLPHRLSVTRSEKLPVDGESRLTRAAGHSNLDARYGLLGAVAASRRFRMLTIARAIPPATLIAKPMSGPPILGANSKMAAASKTPRQPTFRRLRR